MDQQFIELYDANQVWPLVNRKYLPRWPTLGMYLFRLYIKEGSVYRNET